MTIKTKFKVAEVFLGVQIWFNGVVYMVASRRVSTLVKARKLIKDDY